MKKIIILVLTLTTFLVGCNKSEEKGKKSEEKITLRFAHNLAEDHPTSIAIQSMADEITQKSNGRINLELFFNGILGTEREVLEQLQTGSIDISRSGASTLENFSSLYSIFNLPYLFDGLDHFYSVMDSTLPEESFYDKTREQGFIALTYFNGGARSFYTKTTPINTPADLKGLKIRVINSPTSIKMLELLGGIPTPKAYGEVYTGLQAGTLDGAENNPTALTLSKHGEVAKFYSFDEHGRVPDFLLISTKTWDNLDSASQMIIKDAAMNATVLHKELWAKAVQNAIDEATNELGVTFNRPDQAPFREAVQPLYTEFKQDVALKTIIESIQN